MKSKNLTKEQLLNYISNDNNLTIQWIQKREIASWSAIILYLATIWSFYSKFSNNTSILEYLSPVIILFGYILFRFIHSQYASIYYRIVYTRSLTKVIYGLIEDNITISDFHFDDEKLQPNFMNEKINTELNYTQPYNGKLHPIAILLRFWLPPLHNLFYVKLFKCVKPEKAKKKLNNYSRQEASLYSIIILVSLGYIIYLIITWPHFEKIYIL